MHPKKFTNKKGPMPKGLTNFICSPQRTGKDKKKSGFALLKDENQS
jgi:hypothetical protein